MTLRVTWRQAGSVAVVLVVAVTAAGLLAACGGESGSSGQTVRLNPDPEGSTSVTVKVGDTVVVSLAANATTGYEWQFTAGDTFVIESSEYVPDPNPSGLVGAGGKQVVTLEVTEAGSSDLLGFYVRPWETPSPDPQPDFQMTVVSE